MAIPQAATLRSGHNVKATNVLKCSNDILEPNYATCGSASWRTVHCNAISREFCFQDTIRLMTLKLKRTPGLYLVGFMGCGKSTIGRELADQLGWPFHDVDADIEAQEGTPIAQIFDERGEAAFRDLETKMIHKRVKLVQAGIPGVIVLGGGAFVQPRNFELLENNGVTVWLDCPLEIVRQRLGDDNTRPLARNPEMLARLYEDRRPLYSRADFRIEIADEEVPAIVNRILDLPIF